MATLTTPTDICRHCGTPWRVGWESCRRCGALGRQRGPAESAEAPATSGSSGLELNRHSVEHVRVRRTPMPGPAVVVPSEATTRELPPEQASLQLGASTLVGVAQLFSGILATLLFVQMLWPRGLPTLTSLVLELVRGRRVAVLLWAIAVAPWVVTALMLGCAMLAARRGVDRPVARSVWPGAVAASLPVFLLWGWPSLHGHLVSALVRRGARHRASILSRWSRVALVCLTAEVAILVLDALGFIRLPPFALAVGAAITLAARQGYLAALCITISGVLHKPAVSGAPLPTRLACPDCGPDAPNLLRFREGLAGSACPRCASALLGPGQVTTLLALAQVEDAVYRREVRLGSTGTRPLNCPQCGTAMRGVQMRTVRAHGCPACGSLWLDRTGLARLSGGRSFVGASAPRAEPPVGAGWPVLAAVMALALAALPWVGVHAGWCSPQEGACLSVPRSFGAE
jgi:Zn-finger nucleic acid-binding protein